MLNTENPYSDTKIFAKSSLRICLSIISRLESLYNLRFLERNFLTIIMGVDLAVSLRTGSRCGNWMFSSLSLIPWNCSTSCEELCPLVVVPGLLFCDLSWRFCMNVHSFSIVFLISERDVSMLLTLESSNNLT